MALDQLIEELERTNDELQRKMADPAVYSDHREAADPPAAEGARACDQGVRDWRSARTDLAEAKDDPELASLAGGARRARSPGSRTSSGTRSWNETRPTTRT